MIEVNGQVTISTKDYHKLQDIHTNAERQLKALIKVEEALTILLNEIVDVHNIQKILHDFNARNDSIRVIPNPLGNLVIEMIKIDD